MRNTARKNLNFADALTDVGNHVAAELTVAELVRAFSIAKAHDADQRLAKWMTAFGDVSAWALTSEKIQAVADWMLKNGYAPASANRDVSSLGSAYKWAAAGRLCPSGFRSPTLGVRRFDEPIRRIYVEDEKVEALRARSLAFPDRRFGVFVSLLIDTGARKGELLERRWREVDLEERQVLAPTTKNGKPRVLLFQQRTADLMRRVYPTRNPDKLLFEGLVPDTPKTFRKPWAAATADVALEWLHMHDMRHVVAARLLRSGVTSAVAAQIMGHDEAVLNRRYGHLETGTLLKAQEQSWRLAA